MSFKMPYERSVIVACDVRSLTKLQEVVRATSGVFGIGGYKVGMTLVIRYGLRQVVSVIQDTRAIPLPIIYDHQKGGTDIPELGPEFVLAVKDGGADAVILFPFGGCETERQWIQACRKEGLGVFVGGHMTQKGFLCSEGGFISDEAPSRIYETALALDVNHFIVPGNKPELVAAYRKQMTNFKRDGSFVLAAPGFVKQGGEITETGKVAGESWHAIVGSAIYGKSTEEEMRASARELVSQIIAE